MTPRLVHPVWCDRSGHCTASLTSDGLHQREPVHLRVHRGAPRLLVTLIAPQPVQWVRVRLVDIGDPVRTTDLTLDEADLLAAWLTVLTRESALTGP